MVLSVQLDDCVTNQHCPKRLNSKLKTKPSHIENARIKHVPLYFINQVTANCHKLSSHPNPRKTSYRLKKSKNLGSSYLQSWKTKLGVALAKHITDLALRISAQESLPRNRIRL